MDHNVPKESVVELLKQLEQLKRIKALKEKKLQKLKGCSVKDIRKKRLSSVSHASSESSNVSADGMILNKEKSSSENFSSENICSPPNNIKSDHKKNSELNLCDKVAISKVDNNAVVVENHSKFDIPTEYVKDAFKENSTENLVQETFNSSSNQKNNFVHKNASKRDSFKLSDDFIFKKPEIIDTREERDHLIPEKHEFSVNKGFNMEDENHEFSVNKRLNNIDDEKHEFSVNEKLNIEDEKHEFSVNKRLNNNEEKGIPDDTKIVTTTLPDIPNDVKLNNSFENENESPDAPSKSLPSSKNKSSDILDDSLNSNMSFFLSADLFGADVNDKKEDNQECCTVTSVNKNAQTEADLFGGNVNGKLEDNEKCCTVASINKNAQTKTDLFSDTVNDKQEENKKYCTITSVNKNTQTKADIFCTDINGKQEDTKEYCTVTSVNQNAGTEGVILKQVVPNYKPSSPVYSQPILISSQRINCDVFNFPKFSTPTEGNTCQFVNDDVSVCIGNSQEAKISDTQKQMSNLLKHDILDKRAEGSVPLENNFVSPHLNYVLEKRLSSVLDAHYESPKKISFKNKNSPVGTPDTQCSQQLIDKNFCKKRKLFDERSSTDCPEHKEKIEDLEFVADNPSCERSNNSFDRVKFDFADKDLIESEIDSDNKNVINYDFDPFSDEKNMCESSATSENKSGNNIPSSVTKAVNGLVSKVCKDSLEPKVAFDNQKSVCVNANDSFDVEMKADSEVLFVPETEGLGLYFNKTDTEDLLETSTLSETLKEFPARENILNMSSQSKLESPVVNNIVAAVKSSRAFRNSQIESESRFVESKNKESEDEVPQKMPLKENDDDDVNAANGAALACDDSLNLDTSYLEDDTQDLGKFKHVPYLSEVNVQEKNVSNEGKSENESNLNLMCTLHGLENEPVIDVEIILFSNVKYAIIQHKTHIFVWRQEKSNDWIRIFVHRIDKKFSIEKICVTMDDSNFVVVMLLTDEEQYCLQFLLFEKNAKIIKLMENTHWLEKRCPGDSVLLCALHGLMFSISISKKISDVSVHAFIGLKENPRLMTAVLGSTETPLCSICKIDRLPNALLGIGESVLYVWHILEARLVTAVSLHPPNYIPIKECFWATVENGLIYFLTTCIGTDKRQLCQLLAANLATGYCQSAMTYSTRPCNDEVKKINKAVYLEPFLMMAHSDGAIIWSITEPYCSAALPSKSSITTIAASKDLEKWGIIAVGSKFGQVNCFSLN